MNFGADSPRAQVHQFQFVLNRSVSCHRRCLFCQTQMNDFLYACIVIACASFSQSIAGVGFVMVAAPFLLAVFEVKDTVLITFALAVISQIFIVHKHWRMIHPQMFANFVIGSALGAPVGLWYFSASSIDMLKLTIGMAMLFISVFSIFRIRKNWQDINSTVLFQPGSRLASGWNPKSLLHGIMEMGSKKQLLAGSVAGFFGPSIGMPGIPLTVYFSAVNMDKEVARSTTLAFFIVISVFTLGASFGNDTVSPVVYAKVPLLIPALLAGMFIGNLVFPHISQRWFQLVLNLTILYSSCRMLYGLL
jgi:uncharacterized protein